jgi:hypothetical protein
MASVCQLHTDVSMLSCPLKGIAAEGIADMHPAALVRRWMLLRLL